jgi:GNAT superfamily N-acetyltransferase
VIEVSTEPARLDLDLIHGFLAESYWAKGIPRATLERALRGSLCFGAFDGQSQVGFARAITDGATFAYVADVFVVPEARGRGVGKALIASMRAHPELQGLRRWLLVTRDAHGLYAQHGFTALAAPERFMESVDPDVYARKP